MLKPIVLGALMALGTAPAIAADECYEIATPAANGTMTVIAIMLNRCTGQTWYLAPEVGANGPTGAFRWVPIVRPAR